MNYIYSIDSFVTALLSPNLVRQGLFYYLFTFLSLEGAWIFLWIFCIGVICWWELYRHKDQRQFVRRVLTLAISITIPVTLVTLLVHFVIKPYIARPRPYTVYATSAPCPKDFSFPSGHAAAATAAATISMWYDHNRKRDKVYLLLAIAIAYSRIALTCHYLGDVIAGGILGYVTSYAFIYYFWSKVKSLGSFRRHKT